MTRMALDKEPSLAGRLVGGPEGFSSLLQRLGPTFIKIGQYLALRPDLIPQEYCDQLMFLLDRVPPFPWQQARAILIQDLGGEPTEIFAYFNPRPVAAGSLAQIHVARMKDGTEVAIKIQRPNIKSQVMRDLRRARLLVRWLGYMRGSFIVSPQKVVQELTSWMLQELDFSHELANLTRMYHLTADSPFERVPCPYPQLCSSRVITSEYLRGVPLSGLLRALRSDIPGETERANLLEIDRNRVAANLVSASLRQIFHYRFFHADLHPGNLLVLPGNLIGFVDFGLCDELDVTLRDRLVRYLAGGYSGQSEQMYKALTDILVPSEQTDIEAFRRDFLVETGTWMDSKPANGQDTASTSSQTELSPDLERSPVGLSMIRLLRSVRRHRLQIPPQILSMYRALLAVDTVTYQLAPGVDLVSVGREFFDKLRIEESLRALEPDNLQPTYFSLLELLKDSPGQLHQILNELSEGNFALNVYSVEAPRVVRARNRRTRLLVTSILSVSLALLVAMPGLPTLFGISLRWLFLGVLILLYIWIYLQWRQLR